MRRSGLFLFLLELVVMLAVFALAAAVCIRLLSGAQSLSRSSQELSYAVEEATSAAECWKATGSGREAGMTQDGETWRLQLDENWQATQSQGTYTVLLAPQGSGAQITVLRQSDGEALYALTVEGAAYD